MCYKRSTDLRRQEKKQNFLKRPEMHETVLIRLLLNAERNDSSLINRVVSLSRTDVGLSYPWLTFFDEQN